MFPKCEAQRVIAISLGKIANFRSQRGGCSLHKNLLVTNVLQKVRSLVNDDDQPSSWEHPYDRTNIPDTSQQMAVEEQIVIPGFNGCSPAKPDESSAILCSKPVHVSKVHDGIGLPEARDAVNGCGMSYFSDSVFQQETEMCVSTNSTFECYQTVAESEKNLECETTAATNYSRRESGARARCLKRRQSVEDDDSTVCPKRRKYDFEHQGVSQMSWRLQPAFSDSDSETEYDNIDSDPDSSASSQGDNMDAEQICSLVSVFKCSFHGLGLIDGSNTGSCDDLLTTQDYKYQNSPTFIHELTKQSSREGKPHPLRRGMSLPDLCAKQADLLCQKFQQATPVVALTV